MAKSNSRLRDTSSVRERMGPVVEKGPQIREKMIKDLKMKDQKCSCNKGEHWKGNLEGGYWGREAKGKWC